MATKKLTVKEAADIIGMDTKTLRKSMVMKEFDPPIGRVRKSGSKYFFDIYENMVLRYIGQE